MDASSRVAVVGMAGRFPGARDVDELWCELCAGREAIRTLDDDELARAGVSPRELRDPRFVKRSADLEGIELFDAAFFGLTPREAIVTDPQQRLLLELAWEACEDAGHPPQAAGEGAIGVFAGSSRSDWAQRVLADPSHAAALGGFALEVATGRDFLATRVAYQLGLRGPALTVQTACSTSLVAVHLACQSLLAGECDLALAGGVSVRVPQGTGYLHAEGGVASPDGRCRAFDERARGTVAGNGGALVLLRRLEDALADGDVVHAVILGTAINNDGRAKVGFTAPSVEGQAAVVEEALAVAGVAPDEIGYVEAHGTGTPLGDPIEVAALAEAFRRRGGTAPAGSCALGSIKTNLGHLDAAAGIAGLVKAALVVARGRIPPSLHFERPNPRLELERTPFRVAAELAEWRASGPRRAGVSSFGIGGTNAHAVLEEPPRREALTGVAGAQLAVVSARSAAALERSLERLADHLDVHPELDAREVAWTLQAGRTPFAHRASGVGRTAQELARSLREAGRTAGEAPARPRGVAFLFPGQGAQRAGMALGAAESEPVVRAELERASRVLAGPLGGDLRDAIRSGRGLDETRVTQPALFAVEHALARQWTAWGIEPAAMLGHSIGEYVAACLAGTLSPEDALHLVAERGRLMQARPPGSMLAVALSEGALSERLPADVSIASINGPELCVASGPTGAIDGLEAGLAEEGVVVRRLRTSHAFHSSMMEPALAPFLEAVRRVELRPPQRPWVSNVTGTWIRDEQATDPSYWVEHLRRPVRLADGLAALAGRGDLVGLEVGPGRTFGPLVRTLDLAVVPSLPARAVDGDEATFLRAALGRLWVHGVEVPWRNVHGEPPRRVRLPTYPFERRRFWVGEAPPEPEPARAPADVRAARERPVESSVQETVARTWRECLGVERVGTQDDFLELGGSSLLAIQVHGRLQVELGLEFPVADVLEATRLDELVERIERARAGASSPRSPLARLGRGAVPIVCVPGLDGEVAALAPLARALEPGHALLAPRALGLAAGERPLDDVAEIARRHVELLGGEPGPHHLAGHSFGGLVALEMARLLRERGEEVASLALLEVRAPLDVEGACDEGELRELAREHLARLGLCADAADLERRLDVATAHARAALRYRPRPWDGDALLVVAQDEPSPTADELAHRWRSLVTGELCVAAVPGDHLSILTRPRVAGVAEALASWVGAAKLSLPTARQP